MGPCHLVILLCLLQAASPAYAAEEPSLFKSLQQKGNAPDTSQHRRQAPSSGFVEHMREKGIEPIPDATRKATITAPQGAPRSTVTGNGKDMKITDEKSKPAGRVHSNGAGDMRLSDPSGQFTGRVKADGRGGYRTFDSLGKHTKTLTPDGKGGFRVYDASGNYQGRVKAK
ncbi:hypothetical protein G3N56_08620 [Desulfovibrio sulfodismutans]|uniref:Uncharacterized protein n=1 Tax=Desulfolutivibrio sulfodismutans TaxID=63561 RepID=A0A7K3NM08_9BACT|nr:hypothetical protein [Desulfolutivibrio sulfodismutans]NDY56805.1 hypothetical protein [Desulfolutivibrio sulfodismutans]QLA10944.1 hypothetical protein GD606_00940 [Desulfolutivibrio sulfodismutans DSM 3696]